MFAQNGIPHAKGTVFINPFKALKFAKEHGFPLVVKPNVSGFSRGSHFPVTNYTELVKAMFFARAWWPVSVVEQYLSGKNYRVVVADGEIMSVIRRYPPFVEGDGKASIEELIDTENEIRHRMQLGPVIHDIPKDVKIRKYLQQQGLTMHTVVPAGDRIYLYNKVALAPGGIVETVPKESLSPENREMFLEILSFFEANILGIDAIFEKGIEHSYLEQESILLEVNSRPYLKMHDFPRYGKPEKLSDYYQRLSALEVQNPDIF
jgi:D-alanine-D-alanine ligase-like ATP-grasp enzyme